MNFFVDFWLRVRYFLKQPGTTVSTDSNSSHELLSVDGAMNLATFSIFDGLQYVFFF